MTNNFNQHLRHATLAMCTAALLALGGCGAMGVQNPSGKLSPVNATAGPAGERLMLKGFDVVAYHTQGKHAMGSSAQTSTYEGVGFWFASAEHKALFDKEPAKYQPAYGGYCANGVVYGIPWGGDGDTWAMINGRVFIFGGNFGCNFCAAFVVCDSVGQALGALHKTVAAIDFFGPIFVGQHHMF